MWHKQANDESSLRSITDMEERLPYVHGRGEKSATYCKQNK